MGKRFGNYKINWHINDVWDNTLTFWQNHRGKIRDQFISSNTLYRELKVKHGGSIRPYGSTISETYEITFGYHPYERITYISVKAKFIIARGFSGMVPQEIMKKWARQIGIEPIKLTRKEDQAFSEKFNEICNLTGLENTDRPVNFCPICGHPIELNPKLCMECSTDLEGLQ